MSSNLSRRISESWSAISPMKMVNTPVIIRKRPPIGIPILFISMIHVEYMIPARNIVLTVPQPPRRGSGSSLGVEAQRMPGRAAEEAAARQGVGRRLLVGRRARVPVIYGEVRKVSEILPE